MKLLIAAASLYMFISLVAAMAGDKMSTVEVSMDVPDPGWKIRITDMYEKEGKLLIVCEAKHNGGIHTQVISRAMARAEIEKEYAKLPREIYLLGCKWKWGKGYTPVTWKEMEKHTAGGKMLSPVFVARRIEPFDFVGLEIEKAEALAEKHKLKNRIIMIDGKPQPATRDHRPERLNFTIEKGRITKVTKG